MKYNTQDPAQVVPDQWDFSTSTRFICPGVKTFTLRVFQWNQYLNQSKKLSYKKSYAINKFGDFRINSSDWDKAITFFTYVCDWLNMNDSELPWDDLRIAWRSYRDGKLELEGKA